MSSKDKYCTGCKQTLPISQFNKNKSKPDGLSNVCKECAKAAFNSWRDRNREKYLQYKKDFYKENPEKFNDYKKTQYYERKYATSQTEVDKLKLRGCFVCGGYSRLQVDKENPTLTILCSQCSATVRKHDENELLLLQDFRVQQVKRGGFH